MDIWNVKNAEHLFSLPLGSHIKGGITNRLPNMLLAEDYIAFAPRRGSTLDLINLSMRKRIASLSFKFTVIDFAYDCKNLGRYYVCGNSNPGTERVGNACVISWEALQLVMGGRPLPPGSSLVNQEIEMPLLQLAIPQPWLLRTLSLLPVLSHHQPRHMAGLIIRQLDLHRARITRSFLEHLFA